MKCSLTAIFSSSIQELKFQGILKSKVAAKILLKHVIDEPSEEKAVAKSLNRFNNPQG